MNKPLVNFIGCGKLGKTIAKLLQTHQAATIFGIVNTSLTSSQIAIDYVGHGKAYAKIQDLPAADVYFITSKDDAIEKIAQALAPYIPSKAIVLHCSGSLTSDILNKLKEKNAYVASIHPVKSFAHPDKAYLSFAGTYCAIEGDIQAQKILTPLFEIIGGRLFSIQKEVKAIYHAANVFANNYFVALHYLANECFRIAKVDADIAKELTSKMMLDGLNNLTEFPHQQALTGPIQRADANTINHHMQALMPYPLLENAYSVLGQAALTLTSHSDFIKQEITTLLKHPG